LLGTLKNIPVIDLNKTQSPSERAPWPKIISALCELRDIADSLEERTQQERSKQLEARIEAQKAREREEERIAELKKKEEEARIAAEAKQAAEETATSDPVHNLAYHQSNPL
jgi:hypothetical protein